MFVRKYQWDYMTAILEDLQRRVDVVEETHPCACWADSVDEFIENECELDEIVNELLSRLGERIETLWDAVANLETVTYAAKPAVKKAIGAQPTAPIQDLKKANPTRTRKVTQ